MIINNESKITNNSNLETKDFGVVHTPHIYKVLYSSLYEDKEQVVLGELAANALDAHIAAGKPEADVVIELPTSLKPELVVRDSGIGMSREHIEQVFTTYGASDKRQDNNAIGGFGFGSKSPFAIADSFTIETTHKGITTIAANFLDEGLPKFVIYSSEYTGKPDGTSVNVPVTDEGIIERLASKAAYIFALWEKKPIVSQISFEGCEPYIIEDDFRLLPQAALKNHPSLRRTSYFSHSPLLVGVGPYVYKLPVNMHSTLERDENVQWLSVFSTQNQHLIPTLNVGDVELSPSREIIEDTPENLAVLTALYKRIRTWIEAGTPKVTIDTLIALYEDVKEKGLWKSEFGLSTKDETDLLYYSQENLETFIKDHYKQDLNVLHLINLENQPFPAKELANISSDTFHKVFQLSFLTKHTAVCYGEAVKIANDLFGDDTQDIRVLNYFSFKGIRTASVTFEDIIKGTSMNSVRSVNVSYTGKRTIRIREPYEVRSCSRVLLLPEDKKGMFSAIRNDSSIQGNTAILEVEDKEAWTKYLTAVNETIPWEYSLYSDADIEAIFEKYLKDKSTRTTSSGKRVVSTKKSLDEIEVGNYQCPFKNFRYSLKASHVTDLDKFGTYEHFVFVKGKPSDDWNGYLKTCNDLEGKIIIFYLNGNSYSSKRIENYKVLLEEAGKQVYELGETSFDYVDMLRILSVIPPISAFLQKVQDEAGFARGFISELTYAAYVPSLDIYCAVFPERTKDIPLEVLSRFSREAYDLKLKETLPEKVFISLVTKLTALKGLYSFDEHYDLILNSITDEEKQLVEEAFLNYTQPEKEAA